MAILEMKVPSPGESITEVQIAHWLKKDGDFVEKDEELCEIDSDKATLTLNAEAAGKLKLIANEGDTVAVGATVCTIDTSALPADPVKKEISKNDKTVSIPVTEKAVIEKTPLASPVIPALKKEIVPGEVRPVPVITSFVPGERKERREKMTLLRKKVAERLVAVKQETAMLTTFNEVDMHKIMNIRKQYKDVFKEKYNVGLGFMSFFTRAVCEALKIFPAVNARIEGPDIIYHDYCDIGIAVSAPKGLMVPVIRNAETLSMPELEKTILDLATKARDGKISIEEMTGGTFTITNGGVFGSMLSTPIINPPQSAILGMHNIVERPVAINGKVEVRPIMYIALSYDHRIIDGKESVSFLVMVKQLLEDPLKLMINDRTLLGI
jgi:2-oxoglutarate dehydrogenase E2 component (dihydrolipoamide succinyltransferase)